jgi:hypothetical protein
VGCRPALLGEVGRGMPKSRRQARTGLGRTCLLRDATCSRYSDLACQGTAHCSMKDVRMLQQLAVGGAHGLICNRYRLLGWLALERCLRWCADLWGCGCKRKQDVLGSYAPFADQNSYLQGGEVVNTEHTACGPEMHTSRPGAPQQLHAASHEPRAQQQRSLRAGPGAPWLWHMLWHHCFDP